MAYSTEWGIFDSGGNQVLAASRVQALDTITEWRIVDGPIEDGSFTSYNKVKIPRLHSVQMVCDGTAGTTADFLAGLASIEGDTNIYSVATPQRVYTSVNIIGSRVERSATKGLTMVTAEVHLQEVRQSGTQKYTSTAAASGAANVNVGTQQATTPTATQATAIGDTEAFA